VGSRASRRAFPVRTGQEEADGYAHRHLLPPSSSPGELAALVWLIIVINAWNRMGITGRLVAGEYEPSA
jgi:hypothetical protein